jgi:hypothetical protein
MFSSKLKLFSCIIVLALIEMTGLGCAPMNHYGDPERNSANANPRTQALKNTNNLTSQNNLTGSINTSEWIGPSGNEYNIKLRDGVSGSGYDFGSSNHFRAYRNLNQTNRVLIEANPLNTIARLCIFPMYSAASNNLQLVDFAQCYSNNGSNIEAQFRSANINYLVIVDAQYLDAMTSCLSGPSACPPHAEGYLP